ncbi:MAG TPA: hypothetical protein VEB59_00700 [Gemmatimonadales bacterium]|nr:hypothetical protein [Gemmatimonadales bacterium]
MPVSFEDLKPGMVLAADLREPGGRLLLPANTSLTDRHLRYFQMWGVERVEIVGDEPASSAPPPDPAAVAEAEAAAAAHFRHVDLSHPASAAVHRYCLDRRLRAASGGRQHGA